MPDFTSDTLEEERNESDITFTTRLNVSKDAGWFEHGKRLLQQPKNSTAMKQLAKLGYEFVLQRSEIKQLLEDVTTNVKNNKRTGISDSEYKLK